MDPNSKSPWTLRWDLLLRYRAIEIIALWEGRLTTNHLCNMFGIGRQQASKDINNYNSERTPGNLEYDKHLKGYKPIAAFKPRYTTGIVDEYLHLLNRNSDLSHTFEGLPLQIANTEVLQPPIRNIEPTTIRALVLAARQGLRLDVDYVSVAQPNREGRIIVPHTLVFTGLRWHVRAWCEKNQAYRDFVLSRFRGEPEIMDASVHGAEGDDAWNALVTIKLKPNDAFNQAQRQVVAEDYGMRNGHLQIEVRGALVKYALQQLRVDPDQPDASPNSQPIVIADLPALAPWMF